MTFYQNRELIILDTTLREGEQSDGVSFTPETKLEIAMALDEAGVDIIEAGFPAASPDVMRAVRSIAAQGLSADILGHARAVKSDMDAVIACDTDCIGIFLGTTKKRLERFLKKSPEEALEMVCWAVDYAKGHGLKVRFSTEDGTRTDYPFLLEMARTAKEAGADWVSIPDTVGAMVPEKTRELYQTLSRDIEVPLAAHCHNDLGLAVANSLAAWQAGARIVDVCVNGLGERCGITDMATFIAAVWAHFGQESVRLDSLQGLSRLVEKYASRVVPENSPVVGEGAFSHKAGVHSAAVLIDPGIYEFYPPEQLGRNREIVVDKYAGRHAVRARLEKLGIELDETTVEAMVSSIKGNPSQGQYLDEDLVQLAEEVTGQSYSAEIPSHVEAIVGVGCRSNIYTTSVARRIRAIRNSVEVLELSGELDIQARLVADNTPELNQCLEKVRAMRGVESTRTMMVLRKFG